MKRQPRILAGTAMGLLMASAPLGAFPLQSGNFTQPAQNTMNAPLYLAQAKCAEDETAEECATRQAEPKEAQPEQAAPEQAAPEPEAAPAEQPAPAAEEPAPAVEEAAPAQEEAAPAPEPQEAAPAATPEEAPAPEAAPAQAEQPTPAAEEAPAAQQAEPEAPVAEPEQKPRKKKEKKAKESVEQAPADEAAPVPVPTEAPAKQPATQAEPTAPQDSEQAPVEQTPVEQAPVEEAPAQETTQQPPAEAEQPAPDQQPAAEQPADNGQAAPAQGEQPVEGEAAAPQNPEAAPILDSQKDAKRNRKRKGKNGEAAADSQAAAPEQAPAEQAPPPVDDKAAQQAITPEAIVPVTEEKGKRRQSAPDVQSRERPSGADVLKEIGGRVIIQFNNQTLVESNDRERMTRGAQNVYYEDLPRGRTRETIQRKNGSQIVTIRNRNGDIIRRSRITPDGREFVLNYVDESHYNDLRDWRDPGDDLPPMRLRIPRNQYILDSRSVEDPGAYYDFLEQPPVERVQRLYSVSEVKRSARVRDIARRIDLDTLNFEFGSASISDEDIQKLEAVASAMERLLEKNPAETFLIEGHTDAVGTETANLALSDQRAEAVAQALTNAFGIPPENLSTQGYGEEYLKVDTTKPERENRRVAIRRITSLVAPVASAN